MDKLARHALVPGGARQVWRVGTIIGKVLLRAYVCARKSLCTQVCVYVPQMASLGERCAFSVKELISTLFQLTAPVESKCLGRCRVYRLSETLVPSRKFKAHSFLASCCKSVTDSCNRSDAV